MKVKVTYINNKHKHATKVYDSMMEAYKELGIHKIVYSKAIYNW